MAGNVPFEPPNASRIRQQQTSPQQTFGLRRLSKSGSSGPLRPVSWDALRTQHVPQDPPVFFVPTYLEQSRIVERMRKGHEERLVAHREGRTSVSSSIRQFQPKSEFEDGFCLLPSAWNPSDKQPGIIVIGDGDYCEVRYNGPQNSTTRETATIRTDHPIPRECGLYYYEIMVLSRHKDAPIEIGFAARKMTRMSVWEGESWTYHGDSGEALGKPYGPRFTGADVIGCGINFRNDTCFFTRNGCDLGTAFTGINRFAGSHLLYPSLGMKKNGERIRANFGQRPFAFDIDRLMTQEREEVSKEICQTDLPTDIVEQANQLILHHLVREGCAETAKVFVTQALNRYPKQDLNQATDNVHAINRRRIREAILNGDIDQALRSLKALYSNVLMDPRHRDTVFSLKCRKFIEMIRQHSQSKFDVADAMDVDMTSGRALKGRNTKTVVPTSGEDVLSAAVKYGQELQAEFGGDPRPERKKELNDLYAFVAYPDPTTSPGAHLLDPKLREQIADKVNMAILVSQRDQPLSNLERLCAETDVLLTKLAQKGNGSAALINIHKDFLQ
ncbi:SPRY-domain-containing protein [Piedraia hortae CBS 480.64]|uniref:SPRY-domain-containing protein n=1 Tax=Piedraia hortae CBS 480.64 TaxID=1314780 RepID=A0A6A7BS30_9PEZI|nr:SPRY-domain-containing protein [Piedraia hortae CBS 480.64]